MVGIAIRGFGSLALMVLVLAIHIENAEADARLCEIASNRHFNCLETFVGKYVCARDNGQHVDSARQAAYCRNIGHWQCGSEKEGVVGGHRGLQDDRLLVGLGKATIAGSGYYGSWGTWNRGWDDAVGIEKVDTPMYIRSVKAKASTSEGGTYKWT